MPLQVSKDACLYGETYAERVVAKDNSGDAAKLAQISAGLDYYAGKTTLSPSEAFTQVFGIDLSTLTNYSSNAQVLAACMAPSRTALQHWRLVTRLPCQS